MGRPSAASQKLLQFLMLDTSQYGRVTDLVAIEVQDRQHGSVETWVQELVGLPCGSQRTRFCLTIADDAGDDQTWIVERSPEGMAERVPKLTTFMNRSRRRRRTWLEIPPGKENCLNSFFSPVSSWLMFG